MKKLLTLIKKVRNVAKTARTALTEWISDVHAALPRRMARVYTQVASRRAEGFVDSAIKILIAVVIGALLLAGLYALFGNTILPTVTQRIKDMFNYQG